MCEPLPKTHSLKVKDYKKDHSCLSKAVIASSDNTANGQIYMQKSSNIRSEYGFGKS